MQCISLCFTITVGIGFLSVSSNANTGMHMVTIATMHKAVLKQLCLPKYGTCYGAIYLPTTPWVLLTPFHKENLTFLILLFILNLFHLFWLTKKQKLNFITQVPKYSQNFNRYHINTEHPDILDFDTSSHFQDMLLLCTILLLYWLMIAQDLIIHNHT